MKKTTTLQTQAPAGWYPIDDQRDGYWSGTEWSNQVRPTGAGDSTAQFGPATAASTASSPQASQPPRTAGSKPSWYKRRWVIAVAALLVGVALGAAGSVDPKNSPEFQAVSADLNEIRGQLQASEEELSSTEAGLTGQLSSAEAELAVAGDLRAREDALKQAEAALEERVAKTEATLTTRRDTVTQAESDVRAASKAVAKREKAVGIVETAPKESQPQPKTQAPASNCEPGYDPCVPPGPPDVDCGDVDGPIYVTGSDPHGLDADGDGVACES